ncbi:stalk domain-containing protein [Paenibacillus sp. J2TS4]|uniref:stalk domain-containing protein n=1 Tax=Paenibacillus sp. J2TS4 TaxID=2807194 RepID=UPI001B200844|nr:stalk domain-containing protein [Paenibacillus sp. J2TS4]GIP32559.1 hypothetical protein J2TS4_17690 [Paenibacillus sp. J2TS4]
MKKYMIGFVLGAMVAGTSVVYAGDAIQAVLFPVKYEINGERQELPEGYSTLNVDGHAYVPIRYVSESLGAVVAYNDEDKTIQIDSDFQVRNVKNGIRAGHLQVSKEENQTIVEGKLFVGQQHWEAMAHSRKSTINLEKEVDVTGEIWFLDSQGRYMGKAPFRTTFDPPGDQIKDFKAVADQDVSGYAFASLVKVGPQPMGQPIPPTVTNRDPTNSVTVGDFRFLTQNGYTMLEGWISLNKTGRYRYDVTLTFYDAEGRSLGSADAIGTASGSEQYFSATTFESAGKGEFSGYHSIEVTVNQLEPLGEQVPSE